MAHESFEDTATAALMNELFVNIKVDREERPDLDKIYQVAQQMLTHGSGGWPLTMFLTPGSTAVFRRHLFPQGAAIRHAGISRSVAARGRVLPRAGRGNRGAKRGSCRPRSPAWCRSRQPGVVLDDSAVERRRARRSRSPSTRVSAAFPGAPKFPHPDQHRALSAAVGRAPRAPSPTSKRCTWRA